MSINDIKPATTVATETAISQTDMSLRIISSLHILSYLLIIIGLIVGIIYIVKSKKKTIYKVIIGIIIIIVPIIINIVLGFSKTNINIRKTLNQSNNITNNISINSDTNINSTANNNLGLWINKYKTLQNNKASYLFNLFGNNQTKGITVPINIEKLNSYAARYSYYPLNSTGKLETTNLSQINNIAVSSVSAFDENDSLLFIIDLNGQGISFKQCIEQGKFIIHAQGDILQGSMNISANQLGLNVQSENFDDQSNILDDLINNYGVPTYIVTDKTIDEVNKEKEPSIHYKLVYQYEKYVVTIYVQEEIEDNTKKCEIKYIYYYPTESFNNNVLTDNNYYRYKLN